MQQSKNQGRHHKRKPFIFCQKRKSLHQVPSKNIFLRTRLYRNQGYCDNGKNRKLNWLKINFVVLWRSIIRCNGYDCGNHCPKSERKEKTRPVHFFSGSRHFDKLLLVEIFNDQIQPKHGKDKRNQHEKQSQVRIQIGHHCVLILRKLLFFYKRFYSHGNNPWELSCRRSYNYQNRPYDVLTKSIILNVKTLCYKHILIFCA
ncbi:hypothetical protein D9M72_479320 [compost metagenome]